jgi:WD40 repeat protein
LALGGMAGDGSGSVELWKLDSAADDSSYSLEGHSGLVLDLAYSPDGAFLASASYDKTIRLWNVASQQCVQTLLGHFHYVNSISFTPDGNFLASGGHDGTVRLWSIASGKCIESLNKTGFRVNTVEFSRDSQMLLEFSRDSPMLVTDHVPDIYLRAMDTATLEELKGEQDDLMKLSTEQLQQALTENDIIFYTASTKSGLVDQLVRDLDQNQRKEILTRKKTDSL